MAALQEGGMVSDWLLSEDEQPKYSRENINVAATTVAIPNGTVMGIITASGSYVPHNPAVNPADGSEDAAAIMFSDMPVDTNPAVAVIIARSAILKEGGLKWDAGITDPQKVTAYASLESKGILIRGVV